MQIQQKKQKYDLSMSKRDMYKRFHVIDLEQVEWDPSTVKLLVEGRYGAQTYGKRPDENFNEIVLVKTIRNTGVGADPYEAFQNAFAMIDKRRIKRDAQFMYLKSGFVIKNGANYYYILEATVYKTKN